MIWQRAERVFALEGGHMSEENDTDIHEQTLARNYLAGESRFRLETDSLGEIEVPAELHLGRS